jgi:DGQHR domain-containing protein
VKYPSFRNQLESKSYHFLKELGFNDVYGGNTFVVGGNQIDLCGGHEKTLIIVECTNQKNLLGKLKSVRGTAKSTIEGFKKHPEYSKYSKFKFVIIHSRQVSESVLEKANDPSDIKVFFWNSEFVNHYKTLHQTIGKYARYSLLSELDVKPEKTSRKSIPSLRWKINSRGNNYLFIFLIEPHELLPMSYIARRELGGIDYYQRMVNKNRLNQIASYVNKGNIFPNNIVVALDENSWRFTENKSNLNFDNDCIFGELELGISYNTCWIIDGQHRLLSFASTNKPSKIIVSAFGHMNLERQGEYFLDINRYAKPVSQDLIWDLLGSIHGTSTEEGRISNVAKRLREIKNDFFYENIKIPSLGGGVFLSNTICERLQRTQLCRHETVATSGTAKIIKNPFSNKDQEKFVNDLSRSISRFFTTLNNKLEIKVKENLFSNGLIAILIELYSSLLSFLNRRPTNKDIDEICNPLSSLFNEMSIEDIKSIKLGLTSEGARRDYRNQLIFFLQGNYNKDFAPGVIFKGENFEDKIEELEKDFNHLVYKTMENNYGSKWLDDSNLFSDQKTKKQAMSRSKKEEHPIWECLSLGTSVHSIVTKSNNWKNVFEDIFIGSLIKSKEELIVICDNLYAYRSQFRHKKTKIVVTPKKRLQMLELNYEVIHEKVRTELEKIV